MVSLLGDVVVLVVEVVAAFGIVIVVIRVLVVTSFVGVAPLLPASLSSAPGRHLRRHRRRLRRRVVAVGIGVGVRRSPPSSLARCQKDASRPRKLGGGGPRSAKVRRCRWARRLPAVARDDRAPSHSRLLPNTPQATPPPPPRQHYGSAPRPVLVPGKISQIAQLLPGPRRCENLERARGRSMVRKPLAHRNVEERLPSVMQAEPGGTHSILHTSSFLSGTPWQGGTSSAWPHILSRSRGPIDWPPTRPRGLRMACLKTGQRAGALPTRRKGGVQ